MTIESKESFVGMLDCHGYFFNHAYKALKVCPESRVTFQILLKNKYIPRASKPSANMKKALLKVLAQHQNTAAKFTINLCTNAFVESLPLNVRMYFHFTKCIIMYCQKPAK